VFWGSIVKILHLSPERNLRRRLTGQFLIEVLWPVDQSFASPNNPEKANRLKNSRDTPKFIQPPGSVYESVAWLNVEKNSKQDELSSFSFDCGFNASHEVLSLIR
jgi:hypothetical protein